MKRQVLSCRCLLYSCLMLQRTAPVDSIIHISHVMAPMTDMLLPLRLSMTPTKFSFGTLSKVQKRGHSRWPNICHPAGFECTQQPVRFVIFRTKISSTSKYLTCRPGKLNDACRVKHPEGRKLLASLTTATASHFPAGDATLKYEISMMVS